MPLFKQRRKPLKAAEIRPEGWIGSTLELIRDLGGTDITPARLAAAQGINIDGAHFNLVILQEMGYLTSEYREHPGTSVPYFKLK
jgi:hypothetical protein